MGIGEIIGGVIKGVVTTVYDLIDRGFSPTEAGKIVVRNITSLRDEYELEKAEDLAALDAKWSEDG